MALSGRDFKKIARFVDLDAKKLGDDRPAGRRGGAAKLRVSALQLAQKPALGGQNEVNGGVALPQKAPDRLDMLQSASSPLRRIGKHRAKAAPRSEERRVGKEWRARR